MPLSKYKDRVKKVVKKITDKGGSVLSAPSRLKHKLRGLKYDTKRADIRQERLMGKSKK